MKIKFIIMIVLAGFGLTSYAQTPADSLYIITYTTGLASMQSLPVSNCILKIIQPTYQSLERGCD